MMAQSVGNVIVAVDNTEKVEDLFEAGIMEALEEIGLVAEGAAKRLCPVDTGRLRNSITHALLGSDSVAIGTNVEYAVYVHEGTSRMKGRPFLRDGAKNVQGRVGQILKKHLRG